MVSKQDGGAVRASRSRFRLIVLSRPPCGERAVPGSHGVPVVSVVASFPSSPVSKQDGKRKQDKGKTRGSGERRRNGGLDDRIPGSYPGEQMRTSKQDENDGRPRPIPIISQSHGFHLMPNQSIAPLTRQAHNETEERDAGTRNDDNGRTRRKTETTRTTGGQRGERRNENTRAARRQASNETTNETPGKTRTRRKTRRRRQ